MSFFLAPIWLWLLVAVAALAGVYAFLQLRRNKYAVRFTNTALLGTLVPRRPGWRRHLAFAVLLLALGTLTVGMAKPTKSVRVPRDRATVVMAIDVSLSMQATDVAPSRLRAAQDAASKFVRGMPPTINLGLESFAGTPAILVPPTTDRDAVVSQIQSLKLAESTATGEALAAALNSIDAFNAQIPGSEGGPPPARIVLMSDGKQTVGQDEFAMATKAGQHHVPVSTISFGTPYGSIDLDGRQIPVPVDDPSLQQVAQMSGGQFYPAQSNAELHQVYDTLGEQIGYQTVHADVSKPWYVLGTLVCLLAAGLAIGRSQRLPV